MSQADEKLFLQIKYSFANSHVNFAAYSPKPLFPVEINHVREGMYVFGLELAGFLKNLGIDAAIEPGSDGSPAIALKTGVQIQDAEALIRKANEVKYRIPAVLHYYNRGVSSMTDRDAKGVPKWHELYEIRLESEDAR